MEYKLTLLNSYEQVKKGDFLPNQKDPSLGGSGIRTGIVKSVDKCYFNGQIGFLDGDFAVSKEQLDDVILMRLKECQLEILAGKNAYGIFSKQK